MVCGAVMGAAACGDDTSNGGGGSYTGSGGTGTGSGGTSTGSAGQQGGSGSTQQGSGCGTGDTACSQCMDTQCCSQRQACDADATCLSGSKQFSSCKSMNAGNLQGQNACLDAWRDSNTVSKNYVDCIFAISDQNSKFTGACSAACNCGGTDCLGCLTGACCDAYQACFQDQSANGCTNAFSAALACANGGGGSVASCVAEFKSKGGQAEVFGSCIEQNIAAGAKCASLCGG